MPKPLPDEFREQNGAIDLAHKAMDRHQRVVADGKTPDENILDEAEKLLKLAGDGNTPEQEAARDYAWGRLHFCDGDMEEAQASLIDALLHNPNDQQTLDLLAQTNDYGDASQVIRIAGFNMLREFDRQLRARKNSHGKIPQRAYELFDKAMNLADIALDKFPTRGTHVSYTLKASVHQERGENQEALECAQTAQKIANEKGIDHRASFRMVERMLARIENEGMSQDL